MLEINKYKLQSVSSSWGDIMGDIHNQKDLMNYIESLDAVSRDELTRLLAQEGVDIKEWVELQGYLKEHQSLKTVNGETLVGEGNIEIGGLTPEQEELVNQIPNKADKSEIPSLDGYATETWVEGKRYLTEHQPLKTVNGETLVGEGNIEIGGLSPEQEALINQIPRKVEQVRLITDGSVIRYEGAYEGLTFNQIYDLVMDNSKYVYIVMDNNIRFRPSAYDGDAIWFDSSFIEVGKANILRCIINKDNQVSIDQIVVLAEDNIKTVNGQSLVGRGNIDIQGGGLPEEQPGVLYVNAFKSGDVKYGDMYLDSYNTSKIDDELYFTSGLDLYKFNADTFKFELFAEFDQQFEKVFKGVSGQYYGLGYWNGIIYKLDIATGQCEYFTQIIGSGMGNNSVSIIGGNVLLFLNDSSVYRLDEATGELTLVNKSESLETEYGAYDVSNYRYEVNGDVYIFTYDCLQTAKITYDQSINELQMEVIEPIFTEWTNRNYLVFDGFEDIYYVQEYRYGKYDYDTKTWTYYDRPALGIDVRTLYKIGDFILTNNRILNVGGDIQKPAKWTDTKDVAVDLTSDQTVWGQKIFSDHVSMDGLSVGSINVGGVFSFQKGKIQFKTNGIWINTDGGNDVYLNSVSVPKRDELIINTNQTIFGDIVDNFISSPYTANKNYYFQTADGRVLNIVNHRILNTINGRTRFYPLSTPWTWNTDKLGICNHNGQTYAIGNMDGEYKLYKWMGIDAAESWIIEANGLPSSGPLWSSGDRLRIADMYYYDFDTNQLVYDPINIDDAPLYYRGFVAGGEYYTMCNARLRKFDKDMKNFVAISDTTFLANEYDQYFEYKGEYYGIDLYSIVKINLDGSWKVAKTGDYYIYDDIYIVDGNYLLTKDYASGEDKLIRMYGIEFTKPEIPEDDETYVLKATKVGDKTIYKWVSIDELLGGINTITEEILS